MDIREYYEKSGTMNPGKKGIIININLYNNILYLFRNFINIIKLGIIKNFY